MAANCKRLVQGPCSLPCLPSFARTLRSLVPASRRPLTPSFAPVDCSSEHPLNSFFELVGRHARSCPAAPPKLPAMRFELQIC